MRSDAHRIHHLADRLEIEVAPAYAIFASDLDNVFIVEPLAYPTHNVSTLGPRPYLRPLRAAPRGLRAGIIVADRAEAKTYVSFAGLIDEIGAPLAQEIRKANFGGFSGYDEHTVRGHLDGGVASHLERGRIDGARRAPAQGVRLSRNRKS